LTSGPIFIEQVRRHHRRFLERIPDYDGPATTPEEVAERMVAVLGPPARAPSTHRSSSLST
jgi:hypothetical protein